jgi:hypothetical protein
MAVEPCAVCRVGVLRVPGEFREVPAGLVHETCFRAAPDRAEWVRAFRSALNGIVVAERGGVALVRSAAGGRYLVSDDDYARVPEARANGRHGVRPREDAWVLPHALPQWPAPAGAAPGPLPVLYATLSLRGCIAHPGAVSRGRLEADPDGTLRLRVDEVLAPALFRPFAADLGLPRVTPPRPTERDVCFLGTGDALRPWAASVDGARWTVRIGDFPEEPLYHLEIDGKDALHTDDWPATWEKS